MRLLLWYAGHIMYATTISLQLDIECAAWPQAITASADLLCGCFASWLDAVSCQLSSNLCGLLQVLYSGGSLSNIEIVLLPFMVGATSAIKLPVKMD